MLQKRIIPCLLLKGEGLVKTRKFKNPKYVGDPINAIRIFNDKEVDELILLDIDATKLSKEPNYKLLEEIAGECFMPLCYGGGINSVEQAHRIFSLGIEKICIQTAALNDLSIISDISSRFGSQSVAVSIDIKKNWLGKKKIYSSTKNKYQNQNLKTFITDLINAGAGEIILNSIDLDGTLSGMDIDLIREVCEFTPVPLVALGGLDSLNSIKEASDAGASGIAAGSFFVFHGPHRAVLITYPNYSDLENLLRSNND